MNFYYCVITNHFCVIVNYFNVIKMQSFFSCDKDAHACELNRGLCDKNVDPISFLKEFCIASINTSFKLLKFKHKKNS